MLDTEVSVIRLAVSPSVVDDDAVATCIADDLDGRALLPHASASAEVRFGTALQSTLRDRGWTRGEGWACFIMDLSRAIPSQPLRVVTLHGAAAAPPADTVVDDVVAAHLGAWDRSTFTSEKWRVMATGPAFRQARFVLLYVDDVPVSTAAVWAAGPGRPGLIEPLGVDRDRRGLGYGRAIVNACAASLRDMGAGSMRVATPVTQWPAVPLYTATMERLADVHDLVRPSS